MAEYELLVEPRELIGKQVKKLRAAGYVPAVLYGARLEAKSLSIEARALERAVQEAGFSSLLALQIGEGGPVERALIRGVQADPVRHTIEHVDFMRIRLGEKITTEVSVVLVGETPTGGTVVQDRNSVEIECLPSDLIQSIDVDLGLLSTVGSIITVKDLQLSDTVKILTHEDEVIAHSEALRELEEEVAAPEPFELGEVPVFGEQEDSDVG